MTYAWLFNAVGLFATTVGALLLLLHLLSRPRFADGLQTPEAKRAYAADRQQLVIAVALLCLWLLVQDMGVLLL